jgi:hypothetical protein
MNSGSPPSPANLWNQGFAGAIIYLAHKGSFWQNHAMLMLPLALQIFNPPPPTPWFKENPFWGAISGFFAFLLAGVGFAVTGHLVIGRLLVALAWPWAMFGLWLVFNGIVPSRKLRIVCRLSTSVLILVMAILVDKWIRSETVSTGTARQLQPKNITAEEIAEAVAKKVPRQHDVEKGITPELLTTRDEAKAIKNWPPVPLHPYGITGRRHEILKALLNTQLEPRDTIRVGCIGWIEESCVAAASFLILFSEAGWKIDENRVFRLDTRIPIEGVNIESKTPRYTDNLPPHQGHWNRMDASQITFFMAFTWMQIPVHASGNPDMPERTTGVYFGSEPKNVNRRTDRQSQQQLAELFEMILIQAKANENNCSADDLCGIRRLQWAQTVSTFIEHCDCGLNSSWSKKWNDASTREGATVLHQKMLEGFVVALAKNNSHESN